MDGPFLFDPDATYMVISNDDKAAPASLLVAGKLFLFRHGKLDLERAIGDIREGTLYLSDTEIVIGSLLGNCLTLHRTKATFLIVIHELPETA